MQISHFQYKIQKSITLKGQGNIFFKDASYQEAKKKYQEALQFLEPSTFYGASLEQCNKVAEISANLLFNVGCCFFNENKWRQAQLMMTEAITINPNYSKAIYKRALARYENGDYQLAMTDIKQAFELDKTSKIIYQAYEKILKRYNEYIVQSRQKTKELSQRIFNSQKVKQREQQKLKQREQQQKKNKDKQVTKQSNRSLWWLLGLSAVAFIGYKAFKK